MAWFVAICVLYCTLQCAGTLQKSTFYFLRLLFMRFVFFYVLHDRFICLNVNILHRKKIYKTNTNTRRP